jgi:Domain of unknown function (DUF4126)
VGSLQRRLGQTKNQAERRIGGRFSFISCVVCSSLESNGDFPISRKETLGIDPRLASILSGMKLAGHEVVAALVATSFAAGLNLYATVATLGLLAHLGVLSLPPALEMLSNWYVIGVSVALFAIEFFADKIPAFDLVWNTLHTFIRVPVAALLAYRATETLSPWQQLLATAAGGVIAFAAHSGKTAARAAVTASPEPFSNAALSFGEDAFAIFLTWFATRHPYWAAAIAAVFLAIIVALARWVLRSLRALFRGAEQVVVR